ncbi:MAG: BspA family leucine-rich repeat surface protein [Lepagella sp.]
MFLLPGEVKAQEAYAVENGETLTFYYDNLRSERSGTTYSMPTGENNPDWLETYPACNERTTKVVFDASFHDYHPTRLANWFQRYKALKTIEGIENLNTSETTKMNYMFEHCQALQALDLSSWDTSNVIYMNNMFYNCLELAELKLSGFDTSNVTSMRYMFYNCKKLTKVDVTSFDTSNVIAMEEMFSDCNALEELDVSNFDTSKVNNMSGMFGGCNKLATIDVSNFDTSNVTSMKDMFSSCYKIQELDLRNFDVSNVSNMIQMFSFSGNLTTIYCNDTWTCETSTNMFQYCYNLSGAASYNSSKVDVSMANPYTGYFTGEVIPEGYAEGNEGTLTFYYDTDRHSRTGTTYDIPTDDSYPAWSGTILGEEQYTKFVFDASFKDYVPYSIKHWFSECNALAEIEGAENIDTSEITDMSEVFMGCSALTSLDLSGFDTSKVSMMYCMFEECTSLTTLDLSGFDTSNVEWLYGMFKNCKSLSTLDLSDFNTSKVTEMSGMFNGCNNLTTLDISSFDTSKANGMTNLFKDCWSLTSIDVTNFDTSNATEMKYMFSGCKSITSLDLSNFDTSNVTSMNNMFAGCISLKTLDLTYFDTSNVTDMSYMFWGMGDLTTIYCEDTWTCEESSEMFTYDYKLVGAVAFDFNKVDVSMANPETGYFSRKSSSVSEIEVEEETREQIYNLQGIRMQNTLKNLPAGIYIVNGKKTILN